MAKLGEVCEKKIETLKSVSTEYIDYIDIAAVNNKTKLIENVQTISTIDAPSRAKQLVKKGDILVSTVRPNLNAVAMIDKDYENVLVASTGYSVIRCNPLVNNRYVFYFCQSESFINKMTEQATGASYPAVSNTIVKNCEMPLPCIEAQNRIAKILDMVSRLISKRERQLLQLDELVKSRFIEMFGATDRFEEVPLHDSVEEMHIGPFGSSLKNECFVEVDQSYCMVYEQKHAIRKTMDVDTRYVDEKKYKELRRFTVQGGDIIVSCRGTIGETFIIPEDAPFGIMHPSIMKIRVKPNEYNRVFFNHLLQNVLERHEAAANGSGVKMAVTATALGKERFIKPPMKLQLEYSDFVAQVDKSKLVAQKSLKLLGRIVNCKQEVLFTERRVRMNTGIKPQVLQEICELAVKYGVEQVILFGSRARGDHWAKSDIDLAIRGGDGVRFALDVEAHASTLLTFDIVDLNEAIAPELRASIAREGVVLYEKV